jgi:ankyrin repeat protein
MQSDVGIECAAAEKMVEYTCPICIFPVNEEHLQLIPLAEHRKQTVLMFSASYGHTNCVQQAVGAGVGLDFLNAALNSAASCGHAGCVRELIKAGASVNLKFGNYSKSPLALASLHGHDECLRELIQAGCDVNLQASGGNTALIWAAANGNTSCVAQLIAAGASLDARGGLWGSTWAARWGATALMKACAEGHFDCVKLLVNAGSKLDLVCGLGSTALSRATCRRRIAYIERDDEGRENCVKELLAAGAKVTMLSNFDHRPKLKKYIAAAGVIGYNYPNEEKCDCLMCKSRDSIRKQMMKVSDVNMFVRVPQLGLPHIIQSFLLHGVTLDIV